MGILWNYFGDVLSFTDVGKVLKIILILCHGQAQVERGFISNKQLPVENLHPPNLVAQRIFIDHMVFHKLQPHEIAASCHCENVSHVRQLRTRYLNDQKDRSLKKLQSEKAVKMTTMTMLTRA